MALFVVNVPPAVWNVKIKVENAPNVFNFFIRIKIVDNALDVSLMSAKPALTQLIALNVQLDT
jgi:hypothetical protein